jgi:hypothetical protein
VEHIRLVERRRSRRNIPRRDIGKCRWWWWRWRQWQRQRQRQRQRKWRR